MKGIPCEWRQWGWGGLGKLVHRSGNIWGNNSLICKSSSACGVPSMGSRSTIWGRHEIQLHAAQGNFEKCICLRPFSSQLFQVTLEDSGTTLATTTNPNIVDEKCGRGYCSICEVAAPVRRVTIRGLCQLSIFNRSLLKHILTWLLPPGFTITSSTRTGSPCLWEATLPFSSTTDPWAPGCGTANSILTILKGQYQNDNLIWSILCGQYSNDYNNMVWQVRSEGPKRCCHKSVTRRNPSARFLLFAQKNILLNDSGVHSVDFSNVRDDKCHVGVGQSRVRSIKQMSPNPYTGCFFNWYPSPKSSKYKKVNLGKVRCI